MGLGEVYEDKGLYKEAIEEYRRVMEVEPSHAEALYNLALVYEKVDPREAIVHWERYIALASADARAEGLGRRRPPAPAQAEEPDQGLARSCLQPGLVEADDDLTVDDDDRDGHASGEADQFLPGLGALDDVDVLVGDTLRRKKLFRRAAGASGGTGVHDDGTGPGPPSDLCRVLGTAPYDRILGCAGRDTGSALAGEAGGRCGRAEEGSDPGPLGPGPAQAARPSVGGGVSVLSGDRRPQTGDRRLSRLNGAAPGGPDWTVRVVPASRPLLSHRARADPRGRGHVRHDHAPRGRRADSGIAPPRRHAGYHGAEPDRGGPVDVPGPDPRPQAGQPDPGHPGSCATTRSRGPCRTIPTPG